MTYNVFSGTLNPTHFTMRDVHEIWGIGRLWSRDELIKFGSDLKHFLDVISLPVHQQYVTIPDAAKFQFCFLTVSKHICITTLPIPVWCGVVEVLYALY